MRVERAKYLLAAVETGSLRAAAAQCAVSQPALGEQIALLEEELDVVLLTRGRRGVRPTPAGRALIEPLRHLVAAERALLGAAMEANGAYRGRVQIGSVSTTATAIIAPVVARLRSDHPGLRFGVQEGSSADVETAVLAGDVDFGVVTTPMRPPAEGLRRTALFAGPLGAYVRRDHPLAGRDGLSWSDLEQAPIVTMREGTVLWELLHHRVVDPDVVVQAMSARTVLVMVRHGAGVGLMGRLVDSDGVADLVWLPLRDARPVRVCLVQRRGSQLSRSALVVRRLIQEQAKSLDSGGPESE